MLAARKRALAFLTVLVSFFAVNVAADTSKNPRRTVWGDPDLQGVWDFRSRTPFERPPEFGNIEVMTPEQAEEFLNRPHAVLGDDRPDDPELDVIGAYNEFWLDAGSNLDAGRTSLIVDPPNGRLPEMTSFSLELIERAKSDRPYPVRELAPSVPVSHLFTDPESLGLSDRCMVGFNAGPPITPGAYNNNLRIIQTPGYVVIHTEMIHEARIVPTNGRPHLPDDIRLWKGDSIGRWEGDALVIETTNFTLKKSAFENPGVTPAIGTAEDLHLIERFTRKSEDQLTYEYTLTSEASLATPFTVRFTMKASNEKIYEYACHEGNYSMGGILRGARVQEQEAKAKDYSASN